jgi:uncharacterized RDD family membrane protein YckC
LSERPGGVTAARAPAGFHNASLLRRLSALAYESLLLAAVVLPIGFLTIPLVGHTPAASRIPVIPAAPGRALSAILVFAAAGAYFTWSWSGGRRTLPMKTWGLRLERRDMRPVNTRTALIRYLAAWLGPATALLLYAAVKPFGLGAHATWLIALNFLWALLDPERQFLHDRIAGTRIVRAQQ